MPRRKLTTKQRGYGNRWRRLSEQVRRASPVCSECGATTDLTLDHLDERDDPTAYRSTALSRLRVLCRPCNSRRQAIRNAARGVGGYGARRRKTEGRMSADARREGGVLADDGGPSF